MKTNEFNAIVKSAKEELNGTFKSPFVICNLLNKAAKGDFSKVANCEGLTKESLSKVAKVVKTLHKNRYAFDTMLFEKDSFGRFCTLTPYKGGIDDLNCDYIESNNLSIFVRMDKKGREIVEDGEGVLCVCMPIALTITAYFAAFAKVANIALKENEKAVKDSEKAAKDSKKAYERAKKGAITDYNNGLISEIDLANKLSALKEKYANVA